jgi:hypothetical protein
MALSYSIDPGRCRVTVLATAQPTHKEFVQLMTRLLKDPAFVPGCDLLWNRQDYAAIPDGAFIKEVVQWWRTYLPLLGGGRVANVVPDLEPAAFGMARMAEILGERVGQLRAFHDLEEAVRWLDERFTPEAPAHGDQWPGRRT